MNFCEPFSKRQILDSSKMEQFADDNFISDKNGRKFSKRVKNTVGKGEIAVTSNCFFSNSVFKRLVLQTHNNQGLILERINKILAQYSSKATSS